MALQLCDLLTHWLVEVHDANVYEQVPCEPAPLQIPVLAGNRKAVSPQASSFAVGALHGPVPEHVLPKAASAM